MDGDTGETVMPKAYEKIKASYMAGGKTEDEAQKLAAKTYIANRKGGTRSSRAKSLHKESLSQFRKQKPKTKFSEMR